MKVEAKSKKRRGRLPAQRDPRLASQGPGQHAGSMLIFRPAPNCKAASLWLPDRGSQSLWKPSQSKQILSLTT